MNGLKIPDVSEKPPTKTATLGTVTIEEICDNNFKDRV